MIIVSPVYIGHSKETSFEDKPWEGFFAVLSSRISYLYCLQDIRQSLQQEEWRQGLEGGGKEGEAEGKWLLGQIGAPQQFLLKADKKTGMRRLWPEHS